MQTEARQPATIRERVVSLGRSHAVVTWLPVAALVVWCAALFYYLLARYPYDGLYGQDSYAYYYQAKALLGDTTGQVPQPWPLYSASQLYHWPVGYHLHIILGF